ncbi:MAG: PEP-CTERM sorting domain-containing protein [Cyanophyceae cyanobacterium]
MRKTFSRIAISLVPALAVPLCGGIKQAQAFVFFSARDLNPASGNAVPPLTDFPNSSQAEADFLSELSASVATEDFEGFNSGQTSPLALVFPGAGTATLLGSGQVNPNSSSQSINGAYAISGNQNYLVQGGDTFTIDFSEPIAGFGFYITDLGSEVFLNLSLVGGGFEQIPVAATENFSGSDRRSGSVQYEGAIAENETELFTSLEITSQTDGQLDGFGIDELTLAGPEQVASVPEPAAVLSLSLFALWGYGMKKGRQKKV